MSQHPRRAFSLFELLLILALLALLFALLLPAIAHAKLAALRGQSTNNLRQIGLAVNNIASNSATGDIPSGEDDNHFSASAYLLPYIEQDNVFQMIDLKKPVDDPANDKARKIAIKTYQNPLDPVQQVRDDAAPTNYLWNDKIFYLNSKPRFPNSFGGRTSAMIMVGETLKGDAHSSPNDVRRRHVQLKQEDLKNINDDTGVDDFRNGKDVVATRCASWMDGRFLQGRFNSVRNLNDERC